MASLSRRFTSHPLQMGPATCIGHWHFDTGVGLCERKTWTVLSQSQTVAAGPVMDENNPLYAKSSDSQRSVWHLCSSIIKKGRAGEMRDIFGETNQRRHVEGDVIESTAEGTLLDGGGPCQKRHF